MVLCVNAGNQIEITHERIGLCLYCSLLDACLYSEFKK